MRPRPCPDSWWVPSLPWHSSFTGQSCQDLANAYTTDGNGQPNANISNYTLVEIAYKALTSVNDPHNKDEVATAIHNVVIPDAVAGPDQHPALPGGLLPMVPRRNQAAAASQDHRSRGLILWLRPCVIPGE
jgi:hypothetical protein